MMSKVDMFGIILQGMQDTYAAKNADYGDSVGDTYKRFGDISFLTRITDKYNRICSLIDKQADVKDESIDDTILDMANYCVLWLVEREFKKQKKPLQCNKDAIELLERNGIPYSLIPNGQKPDGTYQFVLVIQDEDSFNKLK